MGRGWWWRVVEGGEAAQVTTRSLPGSPTASRVSRNLQASRPCRTEPQAPFVTPNGHIRRLLSCMVSGGGGGLCQEHFLDNIRRTAAFGVSGTPQGFWFNAFEEGP